jgi:hypothetical protein
MRSYLHIQKRCNTTRYTEAYTVHTRFANKRFVLLPLSSSSFRFKISKQVTNPDTFETMVIENGDKNAAELKALCKEARIAFWRAARVGFVRLVEEAPAAWNSSDGRLYRTEKKVIAHHLEPLYWGAFVSVFLFGTFRISGSRWYARFRETNWKQRVTGTSSASDSNRTTARWKSFLDQRAENERFMREETMQLPTDVFVSVMCGLSSVVWLSQPQRAGRDLAEAPLLPGKSVVVGCFCNEMDEAFNQSVDPRILTESIIENDDTLRTFVSMVKNCRIRADYIRPRQEQGLKNPDVIPYPGLEGIR